MVNGSLQIHTARMLGLFLEFMADYKAQSTNQAISIILMDFGTITSCVFVSPQIAIGKLCLGFNSPMLLQYFLPPIFGTDAAAPVFKLSMVPIGGIVIRINTPHTCNQIQIMAMRTDIRSIQRQSRRFLFTVPLCITCIPPHMGNGTAIDPTSCLIGLHFLIQTNLDCPVGSLKSMLSASFHSFINETGPYPFISLIIPQFAQAFYKGIIITPQGQSCMIGCSRNCTIRVDGIATFSTSLIWSQKPVVVSSISRIGCIRFLSDDEFFIVNPLIIFHLNRLIRGERSSFRISGGKIEFTVISHSVHTAVIRHFHSVLSIISVMCQQKITTIPTSIGFHIVAYIVQIHFHRTTRATQPLGFQFSGRSFQGNSASLIQIKCMDGTVTSQPPKGISLKRNTASSRSFSFP